MTQPALYIGFYALGVAFNLAFGPRQRVGLCCALGFPIGLALWVLLCLPLAAGPFPYETGTALGALALALAVCAAQAARVFRPDARQLTLLLVSTVAFVAFVGVLTSFDASQFSPDSKNIIISSRHIGLGTDSAMYFARKSGFMVMAHSAARFVQDDYLYALAPVLGLSLAPIFLLLGWHGLARLGPARPAGMVPVVLAIAVVLTTYMVSYHLFYIHTNLGTAVYLFCFAGLFWLAEIEQDTSLLPLAFVCLLACAMHRLEQPIITSTFVLLTVFMSRLPRRPLTIGLCFYTAVLVVWYQYLKILPSRHMTDSRAHLVMVLVTALLAVWIALGRPRFERLWRLRRHLPLALLVAAGLAVAAGTLLRPQAMTITWGATYENLAPADQGMWGWFWPATALLIPLALCFPPPRFGQIFFYGAALTLLIILVIGIPHPYRVARNDSANRMVIQLIPLLYFYFAVRLAPWLTSSPTATTAASGPSVTR